MTENSAGYKNTLVTGCAGFIGSHLCEKLLEEGRRVVGIDALTPYYPVSRKQKNLESLRRRSGFKFVEGNIARVDLSPLLEDTEIVFHLAGQPGVRLSWGRDFNEYVEQNIHATQVLLEAAKNAKLKKFVYASSSSVYGNVQRDILRETDVPTPFSPYGVTKLAGEHLANSYCANFGVPAVSLRFFTVFGPRQRSDMAFQRIIEAILAGKEFTVYGDGSQTRDFTYVSDIVDGLIAASATGAAGSIYNIGGSNVISLNGVLQAVQEIAGKKLNVIYKESQKGDVKNTRADISKAQAELHYAPKVSVREGLKRQYEYEVSLLNRPA